jgi:hypothetical protein
MPITLGRDHGHAGKRIELKIVSVKMSESLEDLAGFVRAADLFERDAEDEIGAVETLCAG